MWRFNNVSKSPQRALLIWPFPHFLSPLSSALTRMPPCPHNGMHERPIDFVTPSPLDSVFLDFSAPSNGVFLTLLGISAAQPENVVLHQPSTSPYPLPCLSHAASWCPRSKRNSVQTADEETRLAAFDVRPQSCDGEQPCLTFAADAICHCDVESR